MATATPVTRPWIDLAALGWFLHAEQHGDQRQMVLRHIHCNAQAVSAMAQHPEVIAMGFTADPAGRLDRLTAPLSPEINQTRLFAAFPTARVTRVEPDLIQRMGGDVMLPEIPNQLREHYLFEDSLQHGVGPLVAAGLMPYKSRQWPLEGHTVQNLPSAHRWEDNALNDRSALRWATRLGATKSLMSPAEREAIGEWLQKAAPLIETHARQHIEAIYGPQCPVVYRVALPPDALPATALQAAAQGIPLATWRTQVPGAKPHEQTFWLAARTPEDALRYAPPGKGMEAIEAVPARGLLTCQEDPVHGGLLLWDVSAIPSPRLFQLMGLALNTYHGADAPPAGWMVGQLNRFLDLGETIRAELAQVSGARDTAEPEEAAIRWLKAASVHFVDFDKARDELLEISSRAMLANLIDRDDPGYRRSTAPLDSDLRQRFVQSYLDSLARWRENGDFQRDYKSLTPASHELVYTLHHDEDWKAEVQAHVAWQQEAADEAIRAEQAARGAAIQAELAGQGMGHRERDTRHDDVGDHLPGARKDRLAAFLHAAKTGSLDQATPTELIEFTRKSVLWPRPTTEELREQGCQPWQAALVIGMWKQVDETPKVQSYSWNDNGRLSKQRVPIEKPEDLRQWAKDLDTLRTRLMNGIQVINLGGVDILEELRKRPKTISELAADLVDDTVSSSLRSQLGIPGSYWRVGREAAACTNWEAVDPKRTGARTASGDPDGLAIPRPTRLEQVTREGPDWRGGVDVDGQDLISRFGFRGAQYGNWADQGHRQDSLNHTFDALGDLATLMGVPPGRVAYAAPERDQEGLGIAFGARGSGKASAHYEAGLRVINLTKTRGDGTLAHELAGHGLDHEIHRIAERGFAAARPFMSEVFGDLLFGKSVALPLWMSEARFRRMEQEIDKRAATMKVQDPGMESVLAAMGRVVLRMAIHRMSDEERIELGREIMLHSKSGVSTSYRRTQLDDFIRERIEPILDAAVKNGVLEDTCRLPITPISDELMERIADRWMRTGLNFGEKGYTSMSSCMAHAAALELLQAGGVDDLSVRESMAREFFDWPSKEAARQTTQSYFRDSDSDWVRECFRSYRVGLKVLEPDNPDLRNVDDLPPYRLSRYFIEAARLDSSKPENLKVIQLFNADNEIRTHVNIGYHTDRNVKMPAARYWRSWCELYARATESYLFDRLKDQVQHSDYLVSGCEPGHFDDPTRWRGNPYPEGTEREAINVAMDGLMASYAGLVAARRTLAEVRQDSGNDTAEELEAELDMA